MSAMPEPKGGLGLLGIDDETQAAMAQALADAAQRQNRSGPSIGAAPERTMEEMQMIQRRIFANKIAQDRMQAYADFTDPTTRRASAGLLTAAMFGPPGAGAARLAAPAAKTAIAGGSKVVGGAAQVYRAPMRGIGKAARFVTTKADDALESSTKLGRPLARTEELGKRIINPKVGGKKLSERLPFYELEHESSGALVSEIILGTRRPYLGAAGLAGGALAADALSGLGLASDTLKNVGGLGSRAKGAIRKGAARAIESVAEGAADFIGPKSEDFYNGK